MAQWEALRAAGLPSQADHKSMTNAPHITLVAAQELDPELAEVATAAIPLPCTVLSYAGSCSSVRARASRSPTSSSRTPRLASAVAGVRERVPDLRHPVWTPHVTLARRVSRTRLPGLLEVLDEQPALTTADLHQVALVGPGHGRDRRPGSERVVERLDRVGEDVGHAGAGGVGVELAVVTGGAGVALGARAGRASRGGRGAPRPRRARRRGARSGAPGRRRACRGCDTSAGCWRAARSTPRRRTARSRAARAGPCTSSSTARRRRPTGSARSRTCSSRASAWVPTASRASRALMWLKA